MRREFALPLAEKVVAALKPFCNRIQIAGSIRREKPEVNDVDIVAMPKAVSQPGPLCGTVSLNESLVFKELFPKVLAGAPLRMIKQECGQELLRFCFREPELQVDVYRARPETWGVILLVRTGSKDHNVQLCSLARAHGLKLSACDGVIDRGGFGKVLASATEEEIFKVLGLRYVEPKDREVHFS